MYLKSTKHEIVPSIYSVIPDSTCPDSCEHHLPLRQVGLKEQLQYTVPVATERPSEEVRRQSCILTTSFVRVWP